MREPTREQLASTQRNKWMVVEPSARACVNCQYYDQYYHKNRGNVMGWTPTATGYCLLKECQRGALRQPCREFAPEKPETDRKGRETHASNV